MLSSSDAKWRCMWHMFVWSLLMTCVSQFLDIRDHYAFFFFAAASVLVMPVLTAIYSNTSGRHGAGLLRAGYVFCDPVLVCITITPVQLLSRLPKYLDEYFCLIRHEDWNKTLDCLRNKTWPSPLLNLHQVDSYHHNNLVSDKEEKILIIQGCIVAPILLSLLMGRRSRKMTINTYIFSSAYWLIAAIEASDLLETAMVSRVYKHTIFTTEAIVSIVMIITNTYAIVTLCSFLTPSPAAGRDRKDRRFDLLYQCFVGVAGIFFVELPMLVARFQIIGTDTGRVSHGSFYMWIAKDLIFVCLTIIILMHQRLRRNYKKYFKGMQCHVPFDNPSVTFEPEKRDVYIQQKKVRFQSPPVSGVLSVSPGGAPQRRGSILRNSTKPNNVPLLTVNSPDGTGYVVTAGATVPSAVLPISSSAVLPPGTTFVPSIIFTPTTDSATKAGTVDNKPTSTMESQDVESGPLPLTHIPPHDSGTSHYSTAPVDHTDQHMTYTSASPTSEGLATSGPTSSIPSAEKSVSPPSLESHAPGTSPPSSQENSPTPGNNADSSPTLSVLKPKPDPCLDPPAKKRRTAPKKVSFRAGFPAHPITEEDKSSSTPESSEEDAV